MSARLESDKPELCRRIDEARQQGRTIGFVPTMGFLHRGHQSLIEMSRDDGCFTVVSIFVNPAQFGPNEDLDSYPSDLDGDYEKSIASGADLVWYPTRTDLYPPDARMMVDPGPMAGRLCGISRPAFFGGICTVVLKLFHLIRPDRAYFGKKDYQQLTLIRRMVADFFMETEVIGGETIRETDGLAMSSRNARLAPGDRDLALTLHRTIEAAKQAFARGERDAETLQSRLKASWPDGLDLDYLDFRDPILLDEVDRLEPDTRIFLGAWLRGVRLIDNDALSRA